MSFDDKEREEKDEDEKGPDDDGIDEEDEDEEAEEEEGDDESEEDEDGEKDDEEEDAGPEDQKKKDKEDDLTDRERALIRRNAVLARKYKQLKKEKSSDMDKTKSGDAPKKDNSQSAKEDRYGFEKIEFRLDHPDLSRRETEEIERYARANRLSMRKASKSPIIRAWLEKRQTSRDLENASPSSSPRGAARGKKEEEKDWFSASPEEFRKQRDELMRR